MSLNCVDVTVELANEYGVPLMLIASRRQIDSEEFGGGYVNNWTTRRFADYVLDIDKKGKVILARDHGGPWQNPVEAEKGYGLRRAMESAKASYRADLDAGFQILHIDPSVDIFGQPSIDEVLDRVFELYEYCYSYARSLKRKVLFEIGTEEQSGSTNRQEEMSYSLSEIKKFCKRNNMPPPLFIVVQTGSKVMEARNVGSFDSPVRVADELPPEIQVPKMVELCNRYGIYMKAHNTDYLSDEALQWYPRLGIHSANVAPEFGYAETTALVRALEENGAEDLSESFLKIAFESGKWKKWMVEGTSASDRDRAMIAGHYVFAVPEFIALKEKAEGRLAKKGVDLDRALRDGIKRSILRYMKNFRLVGSE